ncbi:hypothetical protein GCM10010277_84660 [Streptomyces longisporoflavus]|nr:hypothetical protein GCM10010277_84660 [Streptomyces longisporoflavus]
MAPRSGRRSSASRSWRGRARPYTAGLFLGRLRRDCNAGAPEGLPDPDRARLIVACTLNEQGGNAVQGLNAARALIAREDYDVVRELHDAPTCERPRTAAGANPPSGTHGQATASASQRGMAAVPLPHKAPPSPSDGGRGWGERPGSRRGPGVHPLVSRKEQPLWPPSV